MKRKYEFNFYSFYNTTAMKLHLENMASKGWFLDKMTNFLWRYYKAEPKKLTYTVSYYTKASMFDPEITEGEQTFQDFCEHSGWHLAASNAKIQIFYNEKDTPVPIYTDTETELEIIDAVAKETFPAYWLLLGLTLMQIISFCRSMISHPLDVLSSSMRLSSALSMFLVGIYFLSDMIIYYLWRIKARNASQTDEKVATSRTRFQFRSFILLISIIIMIYGVVSAGQSDITRYFAVYSFGIIGLMFMVNATRILLKKKKVDKEKNRIITIIVDIVLAFIFTGLMTYDIFHILNTSKDIKQNEMLFTIASITGEQDIDSEKNTIYSNSMFLSQNKGWEYPNNDKSLSYRLFDIHFDFIEDFCLEKLLHEKDDFGSHNDDYDPKNPPYVYNEISDLEWNADRVWQLNAYGDNKTNYVLKYDNKLLILDISWTPSYIEKHRISSCFN